VFPGELIGFIDPDKFDAEIWRPIAERAGMKGTRLHDLTKAFSSPRNSSPTAKQRPTFWTNSGTPASKLRSTPTGICFRMGQGSQGRFEKSVEEARRTSKQDVSNPLAMVGRKRPRDGATH
jgi:hypothetical protein